jgi:ubiquinone/menaquinone biosynthesis C-methylase UbiE
MSFSLKYLFRGVSAAEEREWERQNVRQKTERYLATNPIERFATDPPYRGKVELIGAALAGVRGPVLDLGGNTAGEATILTQQGRHIVVADINDYAIELSRRRALKFGLKLSDYVALDAHHLPFADASFAAVTVIEALHHFADYDRALGEIFRILAPGGLLFSIEPNALNPLRRASEVRDRLRGTIEKSFYPGQLRRLLGKAGFGAVEIRPFSIGRSEWKLREHAPWRRPLARFHGWLCASFPRAFSAHAIQARKPGALPPFENWRLTEHLRSPLGGGPLILDTARGGWVDAVAGRVFPDVDGIPVLIREDAKPIAMAN